MSGYDAFISYSHAKDKPIAALLQRVVQALGKPWYRRRALRLFRDDTSLSATPHLWPTIELALGQSRFLILLASPEAARSPWVAKEVAYWLEHKSIDTLLVAVTDGELAWDSARSDFDWSDTTPLPAGLKGRFPTEPKWVDLRAYRHGAAKRDRRFNELAADFGAAIHGVAKEDLLSEEVIQQRRALALAWTAVVLLMVLGAAASWQATVATDQKQVAQQQRDLATAAERTATEQKEIAEQQRDRAVAAERSATEQQRLAVQQRDRAERTLNVATKTANGLVFDLAVKFREVKGIPLEVVKGILGRGKDLLDDLLANNETAPAVQLIRATDWSELGFTLAQQGSPDGGKLAAEAYRIAKALVSEHADLDGVDYALGRAAEVLGQLREREDPQAAYGLDREAVAAFAKCLEKHPKDLECIKHAFTALGRIGNILFDNRQYNDALSVYQQSLDLALTYQRIAAPGPEVALHIAGRHNHLGRVYLQTQNLDEAMREFNHARTALEPWASDPKASTTFLVELANTYNNLGTVLIKQVKTRSDRDKVQAAIGYIERAAKLLESLAANDPSNLFYWTNLAIDYDNLEFLNGLIGNRGAQEAYARKRQLALERAKGENPRPVAQTPSP
jgi:tetratricopeptide (TPR) repeat protein